MNEKTTYTVARLHAGSEEVPLVHCVKDCLNAGYIGTPVRAVKLNRSDIRKLKQLIFPLKNHAERLIQLIEQENEIVVTFEEKPTTVADAKTLDEIRKIQKALK